MQPEQTAIPSLFKAAWVRTKDRWANYIRVFFQFIILPLVIAGLVSTLSVLALPFVLNMFKNPQANGAVQIIAAVAALLLPVAAFLTALYRSLVGTIALTKVIIDPAKDRQKSIAESKVLLTPYLNFITILSLISFGYFIYFPVTLFTVILFIQVWTQFATFSFLTEEHRGAVNIWRGVQIYKENFLVVTGHAIVIQLIGALIGNIGTITAVFQKRTDTVGMITSFGSIQIFSFVAVLLYQVFSIAYMYEVYSRLKKPETVKTPVMFIFFAALGWIIGLGLFAWGIQYLITHPIQLPAPKGL